MCSMTLPNIFIKFLAFIDPQNRHQFFSLSQLYNYPKYYKSNERSRQKETQTFANYFTIKIRH